MIIYCLLVILCSIWNCSCQVLACYTFANFRFDTEAPKTIPETVNKRLGAIIVTLSYDIGVPYQIATGGRTKICPESAAGKPGVHVWSLLQAHGPDIVYIFFDGFLAKQSVRLKSKYIRATRGHLVHNQEVTRTVAQSSV